MNLLEFDFITPFYLAAKDIFEQLFQTTINVSDITNITTDSTLDDISVSLDLKSNTFQGKVFYFMSSSFVISILNVMIGEVAELDLESEMTKSAILELNNMITGKALTRLSEMGDSYNMGLPEITVGKGRKIFDMPLPMSSVILNNGREKFNVCFLTSNIGQIVQVQVTKSIPEAPVSSLSTLDLQAALNKQNGVPAINVDSSDIANYAKKVLTESIEELRVLSGDNDFVIRKNQVVGELIKTLIELRE